MLSTLIYNCRLAGQPEANTWIFIVGEYIMKIGYGCASMPAADNIVDAKGALALPGVIDCHVHFREPGLTQKADIGSESRAAIAGGVTSFMDMPNCVPPTVSIETWQEKCEIARENSLANYAFFIGATNDNIATLKNADYTRVPGVKLFMGSSTGNMLVNDSSAITKIFAQTPAIVAVHAEDQDIIANNTKDVRAKWPNGNVPLRMHSLIRNVDACFQSTSRALALAKQFNHRLHICHLTTARELSLLESGNPSTKLITSEVSPHHLLWTQDDYAKKGTRIKMNPAVKSAADRDALLQALKDGLIDMVATDHAPHLLADKEGDALTAASGAPLVQFSLVLMLNLLSETLVQRVMCENPALVYHIKNRGRLQEGYYADIVLVRESEPYRISDRQVISKCGWTPVDGVEVKHKVEKTWVNGTLSYDCGIFVEKSVAKPLLF